MVKKFVAIFGAIALLNGCTSVHYRFLCKSFGFFKVIRVFPIDLSSREKQIFHIRGVETPSALSRFLGGDTKYHIDLCVDSIPEASLYNIKGWNIQTRVSMGDFSKESGDIGGTSTGCWWADNSDGWKIVSNYFPSDIDLDKMLTIEFQIIRDSDDVIFFAKNHKRNPSGGALPLLEFHVKDGDSLMLNKFVNPRLVVWVED